MFIDKPFLTDSNFPDDLDTTTLALLGLEMAKEVTRSVMYDMLKHVNSDGLLLVSILKQNRTLRF